MKLEPIKTCLILSLMGLLSSCQPQGAELPTPTEPQITASPSAVSSDTSQPSQTDQTGDEPNPLPPDPIDVVFFSEDGVELQGRFFPAAALDQPVVVLMHWYQGDQREWEEIAYWLQNRGGSGTQRGVPWLDPSWFPALPPSTSYNALTFTFRDCQGGCSQVIPKELLQDANASLEAARGLQGVDPDQLIVIGASIGGDAAISSCASLLKKETQACLGALSISPGNYLGESYPDLVSILENADPPRPAWCFYDEADPNAAACEGAVGNLYDKQSWDAGNLHGMHLITSTLDPLPLQQMIDFLIIATTQ
jgi:hypothetical protein